MRRSLTLRTSFFLLLAATGVNSARAAAQVAPAVSDSTAPTCIAATPGSRWGLHAAWPMANGGSSNAPEAGPPAAQAGRQLAGTYDVVLVMTEGYPQARVSRTRLRLVATDSAARDRCDTGRCTGGQSVPAAGVMGAPGTPFDSAAARRRELRGPNAAEVIFTPREGSLVLRTNPGVTDAGTFLFVSEVTDSALAGRWSDGGIAMLMFERDGVAVGEQMTGYFCAWRR
jgi:hypothetical protein